MLQYAAREKVSELTKDFLKFFDDTLISHFRAEAKALFPALRGISKETDKLIESLLADHNSLLKKVSLLKRSSHSETEQKEILSDLIEKLASHAEKEDENIAPILKSLSKESIEKIDDAALRLRYGYP